MYLKALLLLFIWFGVLGWVGGGGVVFVGMVWFCCLFIFLFPPPPVTQFGLINSINPKLRFTYCSWRGWLEEQTKWHLANIAFEISCRVGKIPVTTQSRIFFLLISTHTHISRHTAKDYKILSSLRINIMELLM